MPHNLRVTALFQIFMENKTPQDNIQDIITETAVSNEVIRTVTNENSTVGVEAAAAQALTSMANNGSVQSASYGQGLEHSYPANHMYTGLSSSTASVPDSVFTEERNINGMLNQTSHQTFDMDKVMRTIRQPGVAAESFRNEEIVAPHLRSQILAGKDINLALLLIPSNDSTTEHRRVDFDGIEYIMKPGDPRLSKFIVAFGK